MRVLFVSWNFPPRRGGIEHMVSHLFDELSRLEEVTLLTSKARGPRDERAAVVRCPRGGLIGFLLWILWRLPREVRRRRPDVLLSSGALVASVCELVNRGATPHAALVFGTDLTYPRRLYQGWLRRQLPRLDRVIAISEATEAIVLERRFATRERLVRLPPGVDPQIGGMPAEESLGDPGRPVLLFVGRVIPRKGLRPFVEHCLPSILAHHDVELWVVGGEASASLAHQAGELAAIRELVETQSLERRVRFFEDAPDEVLRATYRQADLLILPAVDIPGDVEGFGMVFLEAALFGVPAVAGRIGGIPDAVLDGQTGLLVEAGDWEAFADAVTRLLADRELYDRLSTAAETRARSEFAWPGLAARLQALLAEISREGRDQRRGADSLS